MKLPIATFAFVVLISASGALCAGEAPSRTAETSREKITLKQRFVPGSYVVTETMDMRQKLLTEGAEIPSQRVSQTIVSTRKIGERDSKGRRKVTIAFKTMKQRMDVGKVTISYDSEGAPADQDPNLSAIFHALKDVKIVATVAPEGEVLDATGIDEVWDRLAKEAPAAAPMLEQMKKHVTDGMIRRLIRGPADMLPAKPVALGEKWQAEVKFEMPFGGQMTCKHDCVLEKVQDTSSGRIAIVRFSGDQQVGEGSSIKLGGTILKILKMKFSQSGEFRLNVDTGMIASHRVGGVGETVVSITTNDGQVGEMTFKQQMTGERTVRPEAVSNTGASTRRAK
jgi:hypothetical protein